MSQTYDPSMIVASFLGIPISGYADGTFVAVERNNESFTLMVGAGGEAARGLRAALLAGGEAQDADVALRLRARRLGEGFEPRHLIRARAIRAAREADHRDLARREGIAESGYRLIINCNAHGGQEVYHLHVHLVGGAPLDRTSVV
jgi:hypothetical protein